MGKEGKQQGSCANDGICSYERKQREEEEERKAEEKRILEKHEREEREKQEKEKREWEEVCVKSWPVLTSHDVCGRGRGIDVLTVVQFERRQREKKAKEEEDKKKKEAEFEEEMRRRLSRQGYTEAQIDRMVNKEKVDKQTMVNKTTTTIEKWGSKAPVYAKIHRDYLSIETLRYYEIPYEYDRVSVVNLDIVDSY